MLSISKVFLRFVSGISQTYLRHISAISQAYLRCISIRLIICTYSGLFQIYFRYISGKCQQYLRHISSILSCILQKDFWGKSKAYFNISHLCIKYLVIFSGLYWVYLQAYLSHISFLIHQSKCLLFHKLILLNFISFFLTLYGH